MKNAFSKEDREFQEMLMRNAANQDLYGGVGNELSQDIVENIFGGRRVLSSVGTMTRIDENGMPYVYRERVGKILDCGHMAYSLEGFLGECFYGHTVCTVSVIVPIWFNLIKIEFIEFSSIARCRRVMFVTVRSSLIVSAYYL